MTTYNPGLSRVSKLLIDRTPDVSATMHPEKSRLVRFRRPRVGWRPGQDGDRFPPPGTFDFLGFTHYWGIVGRRAASDAGVEAAWTLRLLRDYGQRPVPVYIQLPRRPHLAAVAQPPVPEAGDAVDPVPPSPGTLPASADDGEALNCARVANAICRGAGCGRTRTSGSVGGQGSATTFVYPTRLHWHATSTFAKMAFRAPDFSREPACTDYRLEARSSWATASSTRPSLTWPRSRSSSKRNPSNASSGDRT